MKKIDFSTTPKVSVFTPSNSLKYVWDAYTSLVNQDFDDWEWVLYLNNEAKVQWYTWPHSSVLNDDYRVNVVSGESVTGVGDAKRKAVAACKGLLLVELDHDDTLRPNALGTLYEAFTSYPEAGLYYSAFSQMYQNGEPHPQRFGKDYGWEYSTLGDWQIPFMMKPTPHNVSLIWFAPNHVRAFTRVAYDKTMGYDADLKVLDDLDLMNKLYKIGEFISIPYCLYRQRLHGENTQIKYNQLIQEDTWRMYEENILENAKVWAKRNELNVYDWNMENDNPDPENIGVFRTFNLHRANDPKWFLHMIHERMAPNGYFFSMTPYWGKEFFRPFVEEGMFQVSRVREFWHEGIPYVQANLIARKDGYTREGGLLTYDS